MAREACPPGTLVARAESSPPAVTLQAALASVGRSNDILGSWRIGVARGCRARADHKFLIVPQCTLSAGIGLCGIRNKGDNSCRFCWFFSGAAATLPQAS